MPTPNAASEKSERVRHIFAAMMDGRSTREIAGSKDSASGAFSRSSRGLARRRADPADDYAFLQIARLEQALELLGAQIDAGRAAAVPAFLRVIEQRAG